MRIVDYVSLNQIIPLTVQDFNLPLWHHIDSAHNGSALWHKKRGVTLYYFFNSQRLIVQGKLITLLYDTHVSNFDDIYGNQRLDFIEDINSALNPLFTHPLIDIRTFTTTRIDYCFNLETPYVDDYLIFLRRAFQATNTGRRTDYAQEFNVNGSVYIKSSTEFKKNIRTNYTLNVYNKAMRLDYLKKSKCRIPQADFTLAQNILRVEVQSSHYLIKSLCHHFSIDQSFDSLFSYDVALFAISTVFSRVYHLDAVCDFYTYQAAKQLTLPNSIAAKLLLTVATHHRVTGSKYSYQRQKVTNLGVYPYCLLPKDSPVPVLESPFKLIINKISHYLPENASLS